MYFPEEAQYAGSQPEVKFQSVSDVASSERGARKLDSTSSSKNSLRPPAVIGRVKNFPDGAGEVSNPAGSTYSNEVRTSVGEISTSSINDASFQNSASYDSRSPDGALDPEDFLKLQNAFSSLRSEEMTPYSIGSSQTQSLDPVYALGHEYLNPSSDDSASLESVYYTGPGGLPWDSEPKAPNYFDLAGPEFTYGGGCEEGHQYQLVEEARAQPQGQ
jgi:hypothetical protein